MLHINNACIAFGTEVLFSGLNLNLERGKTACIVGAVRLWKDLIAKCGDGLCAVKGGDHKSRRYLVG